MRRGEGFTLVDALPPMNYAVSHLPGAISIPARQVDERAPRHIPDRDTEVIVYCSGATCDASVTVAKRLVELGYGNVRHYTGGKSGRGGGGLPPEALLLP